MPPIKLTFTQPSMLPVAVHSYFVLYFFSSTQELIVLSLGLRVEFCIEILWHLNI